ncbi:hypothetical protein ACUY2G_04355 [Corynebacterium guaraldiae]|uniref:Uncharacterized protein n=2 Tax=Corynebacterium TaxID=1716 RepID=A0ABU9UEM2_9CORY|nr:MULTISPECIES: hypothetical protein [Corynebacterium]MCL8493070.1 hypothetical protein [Corynebacterium intestinale]MCP1389302.1 hypothetical protein [Corynebacterium intestinale]MCZ9297904.1 hypothetical protein [Corynebacterium hesseae]MDK8897903.1 hypothetical protein [Corynebacterium sp. MSK004]
MSSSGELHETSAMTQAAVDMIPASVREHRSHAAESSLIICLATLALGKISSSTLKHPTDIHEPAAPR